jgi:hypothetical protein
MNPTARNAVWVLESIENGSAEAREIFSKLEALDPVLVYFIFRFLREKYGSGNPAGEGVMKRVLEITENHPNLVAMSRTGEKDPIREWFDDTYTVREYFQQVEELIEMLVEKIEG